MKNPLDSIWGTFISGLLLLLVMLILIKVGVSLLG